MATSDATAIFHETMDIATVCHFSLIFKRKLYIVESYVRRPHTRPLTPIA